MSWKGLRHKGVEILWPSEWNAVVDALDELYGKLTTGQEDIKVDEVFARTGHFTQRIDCEGRPVILDGDPITIYQFYDLAKEQIREAIDSSKILSRIHMDEYGNIGIIIVEPVDEYGRVKVAAQVTLPGLDDSLKAWVTPLRAETAKVIDSLSIAPNSMLTFTDYSDIKYSAFVFSIRASYDPSATKGVRIRWLYSPDGTNWDSPEEAEDQGNYEDLTFLAGATRQRTIVVPILQPYVQLQLINLDPNYSVTVSVWETKIR
jgi:hypothetical protein